MVGFWIFLIVLCICLTVISCLYMEYKSDVKDLDWTHYREIIQLLGEIQKIITETKGSDNQCH